MQVYEDMAEVYDLLYYDAYDSDFYLREARNARGPVLDVGCGTGRILLKLLADGIDVTGIDISDNMLAVLRKKAEALGLRPNALKGDMRDFAIDKKFMLIIVPYRSFLHLLTEPDRKKTLMNFLGHLDTGGRLILHTYDPSQEELECTDGYHHTAFEEVKTPDGKPYRLDWYLNYDRKAGVGHYRITITKDAKEQEFRMDLSFVSVNGMKHLLESCGYRNVRPHCGFNYAPYDKGCMEVLWFAEKK